MSLFSSNEENYCIPFALNNQTNNTKRGRIEYNRLEPENEYGNVEYKLRLTNPTADRVERLVTQLKWRIREGNGEAIVYLGVRDDGQFVGLTPDEARLSLQTLERMSSKIGAKMSVVKDRIVNSSEVTDNLAIDKQSSETAQIEPSVQITDVAKASSSTQRRRPDTYGNLRREVNNENIGESKTTKKLASATGATRASTSGSHKRKQSVKKVIQVLVKRKTPDISEELRVVVLGPTESGKSSLLGVISHGEQDNGRGSSRLNLFRHRHEIKSGHTSSISQEIFGFNSRNEPLTYKTCLSTEEIIESSTKIVTLIDLAGHQRYLGTTLFGLGSYPPDVVLLVISSESPINNAITDNISLALGMGESMAIVINKSDLISQVALEACYDEIVQTLNRIQPDIVAYKVTSIGEATIVGSTFRESSSKLLPIFFTSCVTKSGMDCLYAFFNVLPPKLNSIELNNAVSEPAELQVDETFELPGIGTVVSGLIIKGVIREGDEMWIGPSDQADFSKVSIISLQRHKIPCNFARAGQKCTMAIQAPNIKVRRGMVMKEIDPNGPRGFSACLQFEASVRFIGNKQPRLAFGSQVSVYVANVRQTCRIDSIESRSNGLWLVCLRLTKRPEFIRKGSRLIMRHTMIKGVGEVTRVVPIVVSDEVT